MKQIIRKEDPVRIDQEDGEAISEVAEELVRKGRANVFRAKGRYILVWIDHSDSNRGVLVGLECERALHEESGAPPLWKGSASVVASYLLASAVTGLLGLLGYPLPRPILAIANALIAVVVLMLL
jgi:hypothetical protein